ncbi:MAG: Biotin-requiring enzyme [Chloroflexota bacterium]|jgi:biotin carboxyl carrier protein|nr:Biotin-requiring enzyme [Chloroflexota bacterium]
MTGDARPPRTTDERLADHAAIERLAGELVPALVAKLAASGLGEIEVGEDAWTVRVRRPADSTSAQSRRASDRASRSQPGHSGHGHAPAGVEAHPSSNGSGPAPSGDGRDAAAPRGGGSSSGAAHRAVATSPAVGVFQPRTEITPGSRVRNGDRLGAVDMLGIPQEVVAPVDGILGATLVEAGQAVEYGQDLIVIELVARPVDRGEA